MATEPSSARLCDLLITTKDGDWGKDRPEPGRVPYRVIRGADFPQVLVGEAGGIPRCYLKSETVHRRTLQAEDIIIETAGGNRDRPTGRTLLVTQRLLDALDLPATCASFSRFLRVNPTLAEPRYIFWFLQWLYARGAMWEHQVQHTGVARFQYTRFAETTVIPLPDRAVQQAIACILGALDEKIELNERMDRTLTAVSGTIFKSWFVDFDPVKAKAAGERPSGLARHIADLFPDDFENPELAELPKGWTLSNVGAHFRLTMGQSPPGSTYNEIGNGVPFYQGSSDFGFRFPSRRVFCTAPTRLAEPGDTLVSVRAPVGDVNMAIEKCAIGRGVAAIRHKSGSRSFTYYAVHNLGEHFRRFEGEGTVFGSINKTDFEHLPFILPPAKVLNAFDRAVSSLDDRIEANEQQSSILAALRNALLPKLFSGQLQIPDAERIVGRFA